MVNPSYRVGFCISGGGRLFRSAVLHREQIGLIPAIAVAESKAAHDLEAFCDVHQVSLVRMKRMPRTDFDAAVTRACVDARLDLLSLTFDKIIPPALVSHYRGRVINVHPGLLPAFKGMNALDQVVSSGARFAGATIHEVDEETDHGAIIAQCVLGLRAHETSQNLGCRMFGMLRLMYLQVLTWYATGRVEKDREGRICVRGATYGESPISPAVEQGFPD